MRHIRWSTRSAGSAISSAPEPGPKRSGAVARVGPRAWSLVTQVLRTSFLVLVLVLAVVGLATGALLYLQERRDVDAELLAAARAAGDGDIQPGHWGTEHADSAVDVRMLAPDDPLLPAGWAEHAEDLETPAWRDDGDRRVLFLPVERGAEGSEDHEMIVASTPRVTWMHSAGRFALAYALVAALAALIGGLVQEHLLLLAVAPLFAARAAVGRVMGAGAGARLDERGPVEVAELLHAVNGLLTRLDQAFAAQARFTSEAAHELRSPITVMLGELDVALRRPRDAAEYEAVLRSTREEVARLAALVEGLLLLTRVDTGQAEQAREPVLAAALMSEAARGGDVGRAGGVLTVDTGAVQNVLVRVHPALVVAALANLLRNAAVHAAGSPVRFHAAPVDGFVRFEVDDAGPGVPVEDRGRVFDRLTRGRGSATTGLGLGLSLAREVACRHGGDCFLAEAPGGGCRAVLDLPVA